MQPIFPLLIRISQCLNRMYREIATSQYILAWYNADDTLISIKNTLSSTYTDEEIESYCKEILSSGKELGTIYHLRYLKQTNDMGTDIRKTK